MSNTGSESYERVKNMMSPESEEEADTAASAWGRFFFPSAALHHHRANIQ